MTLEEAINAYRAAMRRRNFKPNSQQRYGRQLDLFAAYIGPDTPVADIGPRELRAYIDTFDAHAPSTIALVCTILSSFFKDLALDDVVAFSPMEKVRRPKVPALRDRERTRVSSEQVATMLAACENWTERLCLYTLAYMGVRRTALANLRWRDVDGKRWTAAFVEKGGKRITKPIPHELRKVYTDYAMHRAGDGDPISPDEWVVPNHRPLPLDEERSPRIVYTTVKRVANRCGIKAHVHAFRAAFAVRFLTQNPAKLEALRQLMGHNSINTTQGYLDELEGEAAMRDVETMTFGGES